MTGRMRIVAAAALLTIGLAGCGGAGTEEAAETDGAASPQDATTPAAAATTPAAAATTPAAAATTAPAATATAPATAAEDGATVAVAESDLGEILVDGEGMSLYLFTNDSEGESSCYDDCAATWPPLEGDASAGENVDAALLGTIERDDGSTQVTYNGHPLYYYAADQAAGDVNGQGVGDVWFAVTPEGEQAGEETGAGGY